jgi:Kinesin motor domain
MPAEAVKVIVRCRPLNGREKDMGETEECVAIDTTAMQVFMKSKPNIKFTFDAVFDWNCIQKDVYESTGYDIANGVLEGFNGTIFAYGQTGTGKTHCMMGPDERKEFPEQIGITPRCFQQVFDNINTFPDENSSFLVEASFLEIYNEDIRDLFAEDTHKALDLKQDTKGAVYVKDLTKHVVKDMEEIIKWMEYGDSRRTTGSTAMNHRSSRSHSIFTIIVGRTDMDDKGEDHVRQGKLNLVDLAGSERQNKTGATGDRLKEGVKINLSLSALGNVISALVDGKSKHIPYRDSKLTRMLQDSLGGNSKTVMVATISPALDNAEETMSTLRYANRAKQIKNKPTINEDPKDAKIREFKDEIARMRALLGDGFDPNANVEKKVVVRKEYVDFEVEGVDPAILEQMKTQKESEVMAALAKQGMSDSERQALQKKLDGARRAQEKIARQQKELEAKMLELSQQLGGGGGMDMMDENDRQQARLRLQEQNMKQQLLDQERLERELKQREHEESLQLKTYATLEEDIAAKDAKLQDLHEKYEEAVAEAEDIAGAFQQEREDLLNTVRGLSKTLKFNIMLVNSFIPAGYLRAIQTHATLDSESGSWKIDWSKYTGFHTYSAPEDEESDIDDSDSSADDTRGPRRKPVSQRYVERLPKNYLTYKRQAANKQRRRR